MKKKTVAALFPTSAVNGVLDNLSEQDYSEKNISVIAADQKVADNYASPNGPWNGKSSTDVISLMSKANAPSQILTAYTAGFNNGMICVAVNAASSQVDSVSETVKDAGGESLFVL